MSSSAEPVRVVLVDDVSDVRAVVRAALSVRGGFEVVGEAPDGNSAVELAEKMQPDVVVLDVGLPDLAGREVLTRIRERSPLTKLIVFSGTPNESATVAKHADAVVRKDVDIEYLIDILHALGAHRGQDAQLHLGPEAESVPAARRFARSVLQRWNLPELLDEVLLIVSELVTNAVTHARSPARLRLGYESGRVRVEVADEGGGTPDPSAAGAQAEHGRGLHLVATFAAAWGVDQTPSGKIVWAELVRR